jgi:hypothetical protein
MSVMTAVSVPAASEPNFAALAARYDSEDDSDSEVQLASTSAQPIKRQALQQQVQHQQQPAAAAAADAGANPPAAVSGQEAVTDQFEDSYEDEGFEDEDSDEGDDDELYAALEWADSREGACAAPKAAAATLLLYVHAVMH